MSYFLVRIFTVSLQKAVVPSEWLLVRAVPIFKTGDRLHVENYRPISITCAVYRMLEHIISKYSVECIETNNPFYAKEHGFRRRLSTVTQLFEISHCFTEAINSKEQIDAVSIDLSKAFDRIRHVKLITKLCDFGINPGNICCIQAYLQNRLQFVEIAGEHSCSLPVTSGVPQGSVLGPILFLLYVNDISDSVHPAFEVRLFADDCLLFCRVRSVRDQELLNDSLKVVHDWCVQ